MEMVGNETFKELVSVSFEIKINLTESEMFNKTWVDPFDSVWLRLGSILVYVIEVLESVIMMAFVVYETNGYNGHYRTLINQLLSHLYGGVGYIFTKIVHTFIKRQEILFISKDSQNIFMNPKPNAHLECFG